MKTILVTGAAGFIGSYLVKRLCESSAEDIVIGVDNMNDYYDVRLKEQRLEELLQYPTFKFIKGNHCRKK
jgi:nucleoside-diphosphate-sugar epimerase